MLPTLSRAISASVGAATLRTASQLNASSLQVAPAAVNIASGMRAEAPAPGSTTTSSPELTSRLTTAGTRATRRSPGAVSFGTPTDSLGACEGLGSVCSITSGSVTASSGCHIGSFRDPSRVVIQPGLQGSAAVDRAAPWCGERTATPIEGNPS